MIPAYWSLGLPAYLWQVTLHSAILAVIFYLWARRVRLPSGRTKRNLLTVLLVLPLVTAAVPGRSDLAFRGRIAWLDSGRLLATPLPGGVRLYHVAILIAAVTVLITVWQEVIPLLVRSRSPSAAVPDRVVELARSLRGWEQCDVRLTPATDVDVATGGWLRRPRLIVSQGALTRLNEDELEAVLKHEHAHWQSGRWRKEITLFVVRLVQFYNPVALWAFREYCVEVEIECDHEAIQGNDPNVLARILLRLRGLTDDIAAKSTLRKRIEVLLDPARVDDDALPTLTIALASLLMLLVLPWAV